MLNIGLSSSPSTITTAAVATSSGVSTSHNSPLSRSSSLFMESPEITGLLYKRRGGFGKIMPNAWQFRLFILSKEGILAYYDTDLSDSKDGTSLDKDRGHIDLKHLHFDLLSELVEGAPTTHVITIVPDDGSEKWRLCAETKEDYMRWYKVFEKYCHLIKDKDHNNTSSSMMTLNHRSYNRQSIIPSVLLMSGFNQEDNNNNHNSHHHHHENDSGNTSSSSNNDHNQRHHTTSAHDMTFTHDSR